MPAKKSNLLSADNLLGIVSSLLLAAICYMFLGVKGDVDELKKDTKEMLKQSFETRIELAKGIGAVEKQAIATNARLDQLIAGQKR